MTEVDLYNLEPILELMAVGLAVAALPLGWWLWQQRRASPSGRLKALTLITLFLTFDLVLFGAFTRLTDSGLGCPDWPGCYGSATPIGAKAEIKAAETAMPTGPVTKSKAQHRPGGRARGEASVRCAWCVWRLVYLCFLVA